MRVSTFFFAGLFFAFYLRVQGERRALWPHPVESHGKEQFWNSQSHLNGHRPSIRKNEIGRQFHSRSPFDSSNSFEENEDYIIFDEGNQDEETNFRNRRPQHFFPHNFRTTTRRSVTNNNNYQTSTIPVPGMETRSPICEENCPSTNEFNPICADDDRTYNNIGKFNCAIRCGKRLKIMFRGLCVPRG